MSDLSHIPDKAVTAHRITFTVTPLTDAETQQVIDDIRARFGRKPLIHVIARQPSNTHVLDAPLSAHREAQATQDQRIEIARALGLADDVVFDLEYLVDSIERLRQSADRDTETAALLRNAVAEIAELRANWVDDRVKRALKGWRESSWTSAEADRIEQEAIQRWNANHPALIALWRHHEQTRAASLRGVQ